MSPATPFGIEPSTTIAVAWTILCVIAGMTVPTRYGIERLNGFGRWLLQKLPYQPPPGTDQETAMQAAAEDPTDGEEDQQA